MDTSHFHVTVKAIVVVEEKIVLLKKHIPSVDGHGFWELPGGGVQVGESPTEAVIREVFEETGLEVVEALPKYTFCCNRNDKQIIGIGFLCNVKGGTVTISFEHQDYIICSLNDAKEYLSKEIYQDVSTSLEVK